MVCTDDLDAACRAAFDGFDRDRSGDLDLEELTTFLICSMRMISALRVGDNKNVEKQLQMARAMATVEFERTDLARTQTHRRAHMGIGYMPEDRRLVPELTAEENIMLPVFATGMADADNRLKWIYGLMPEVEEFRARGATQLSGGQQKFVAFARALMAGTQLLLLDEPSEGIAPVFAHRMVEIMQSLKREGQAVLVAESNDTHIAHLLDHTFVIERGAIIETR